MTIVLQRFDDVRTTEERGGFGALTSTYGNLPLKQLAYRSSIVALAVRTTILQTYYNPFDQPIEATYIFPIEGQTAVVACEMRIGDRIVRAQLKERGQARADFDRAIRSGHRAALLEENRPETFSMRVGNIPPGEAVQVCIETVTQLATINGEWTLRLPLVVAPKYTSGLPLRRSSVGGGTSHDTDQVPDASTISPPTWLPGFASPVDLRLSVELQMGELAGAQNWIENLKSSLHSVVLNASTSGCRIDILPGERVDRDFILRGRVDDTSIRTTLTAERSSSQEDKLGANPRVTFAINVVPPRVNQHSPRDVVFLLDRSGSMEGWKIKAARRGISRLIDSLLPTDRFQAIAFDNQLDAFSNNGKSTPTSWQIATDANRYEATRWLSKINSRGGTEMGRAIASGLKAYTTDDAAAVGRSLAMVLVTDGQITGEDSVLRLLGSIPEQRRPRLFCLGIDRSVNASVLQRIAAFTGGSFELVESEKRLDEVLKSFAELIGAPAITKLKVEGPGSSKIQLAPARVDALYSGRSLTIYGQTELTESLNLKISGALPNGQAWSEQVFANVRENSKSVLLPLWGKSRVRELEDELAACGTRDQSLKNEIIGCSLACGVLSRLTAFVAVDETEVVTRGQQPHSIIQPTELPEGWGSRAPALDRHSLIAIPGSAVSASQATVSSRTLQESSMHIAERLLKRGTISQEQLSDAQSLATQQGCTTLDALLRLSYAQDEEIALAAAETSGSSYMDARGLQVEDKIIAMLPESIARESCVLPIASSGDALTILVSDPFNLETVEKLRFVLNRNIVAVVGSASAIGEAINRHYGAVEGETADSCLQEFTDTQIDFTETADEVYGDAFGHGLIFRDCFSGSSRSTMYTYGSDEALEEDEDRMSIEMSVRSIKSRSQSPQPVELPTTPVVRLVSLMIHEAVQLRASHILIVPEEDSEAGGFTLNYIIDGNLVERDSPKQILTQIITHLKILAKLDIANRESLQSGKIHKTIGQREVELVVHIAGRSLLLEITPEAFLSPMPAAVEEWWQLHKV